MKGRAPVFFGGESSNDIYASDYENRGLAGSKAVIHINRKDRKADFEADIPLPGEHMLYNALAAAAVGVLFGLSTEQIQEGIRDVESVGGRSHVIRTGRLTLIDDCYNANPVSMKAALDLLTMTGINENGRRVAVLGDMFELGTDEAALHYEVGAYAADKNIDVVICVGKLCKNMYDGAKTVDNSATEVHYYPDKEELLTDIDRLIKDKDIILVKASHGMHFEELISRLS